MTPCSAPSTPANRNQSRLDPPLVRQRTACPGGSLALHARATGRPICYAPRSDNGDEKLPLWRYTVKMQTDSRSDRSREHCLAGVPARLCLELQKQCGVNVWRMWREPRCALTSPYSVIRRPDVIRLQEMLLEHTPDVGRPQSGCYGSPHAEQVFIRAHHINGPVLPGPFENLFIRRSRLCRTVPVGK